MTKQQFIQELSACLLNEVDSQEYHNSVQYYTRYIEDEVGRGKTEQEVTKALGSPRLIARTIIDSQPGNNYNSHQEEFENIGGYGTSQEFNQSSDKNQSKDWNLHMNGRKIGTWYEKLGLAVIALIAIMVILGILGVAFTLIWHVVLPIVIIAAIFKLISSFFRK